MTLEQALQILIQALVMKSGLSIQDAANVVQAWNIIAQLVESQKKENNAGN